MLSTSPLRFTLPALATVYALSGCASGGAIETEDPLFATYDESDDKSGQVLRFSNVRSNCGGFVRHIGFLSVLSQVESCYAAGHILIPEGYRMSSLSADMETYLHPGGRGSIDLYIDGRLVDSQNRNGTAEVRARATGNGPTCGARRVSFRIEASVSGGSDGEASMLDSIDLVASETSCP